jgi:carboxymethylenebutenolidase
VTGFCWGGETTNLLATALGADLQAGVPFYGPAPEAGSVPKIKAPLLIHLAESDPHVNTTYPAYEQALKSARVRYELHTYPGT